MEHNYYGAEEEEEELEMYGLHLSIYYYF